MTVVYNFTLCRLSWILNSIPSLSKLTLQNFEKHQNRLSHIENVFEQMQNAMTSFEKALDGQHQLLNEARDFGLLCNKAAALDDIDAMIAARDYIVSARSSR